MHFTRGLCLAAFLGLVGVAGASGFATNIDFETDPILSDGQTPVGDGQMKLTETSPESADYLDAISGIVGWQYSMDEGGTGTDVGLARAMGFADGNDSQVLFTNRWDKRVSQTLEGLTIQAGYRYTFSVRCYVPIYDEGDFKVGTISLYAGTPLNPDDFVLLNQLDYANAVSPGAWPDFGGDHSSQIGADGWVDLTLSYTAQDGDVNLGESLTTCMVTQAGSIGPVYWDNVTYTAEAVPEPLSIIALGLGSAALLRRRRK